MGTDTPPNDAIVEQVMEADRVSEENYRYYDENIEKLKESHDGEIIAIIEEEVVASRDFTADISEIQEFFNGLRREHGERRAREAYITHVPESDEVLLL